jgi:hypothetical protein
LKVHGVHDVHVAAAGAAGAAVWRAEEERGSEGGAER